MRTLRWVSPILASIIVGAVLTLIPGTSQADGTRYFASNDPVNLTVTENRPTQYSNSSTLASTFGSTRYDANIGWGPEGTAIYEANASTPTYTITPRQSGWGNPFQGYRMPWDPSWEVPTHVDGRVVVLAADKQTAIECWETQVNNGVPSCQYGAVSNPSGSSQVLAGGATGANFSWLSGTITQEDWDNGIDHALTFGTPDNNGNHVYPATRTDGSGSGAMTEGDYIWMDSGCHPSGLNATQQRIFDALQKYGAYNVDNAETFGFGSEYHAKPPGVTGTSGWVDMKGLPWASCLHVGKVTPGGTPSPSPSPTTSSPTPTPTTETPTPTPTITPTSTPTFVPSVLTVANKCRYSSTDKRNKWIVKNVQGPRDRQFWVHVSYNGNTTYEGTWTVPEGSQLTITTSHGGQADVSYYDGQSNEEHAYATSNASILC